MTFDALGLIARLVLGPVLLVQGLYIRKVALILPEAAGPRSGYCGTGKPVRILVLGDSAAAGVGVETQDEGICGQLAAALSDDFEVHWRIIAKTGATTASTLATVEAAADDHFDVIVISLGVNDITRDVGLSTWIDQQLRLQALLSARYGAKQIFVSGMPPVSHFPLLPQPLRWFLGRTAKRFDKALQQLVLGKSGCVFVPLDFTQDQTLMSRDGFHPGPEIYCLWASFIAGHIRASDHFGIQEVT
jgi:lysophospholipase L1-like esterase